jgi:ABC-type cobalamin/Fe3+-siderophores transport system ATPase subunit
MIEVENLSKRYGERLAVDGLSFVVQPGIVTGFLGPNGAVKSTTMRMIAGLDEPTADRVVVNGRRYRSARAPMTELGVLLEAKAVHIGRLVPVSPCSLRGLLLPHVSREFKQRRDRERAAPPCCWSWLLLSTGNTQPMPTDQRCRSL